MRAIEIPARSSDGHEWVLLARMPDRPVTASLLWLPALGVAARHYLPFAEALAACGIAVFLHEWRGSGSSTWRASRARDWGYRELLILDLPASQSAIAGHANGDRILGGHSLGGQLACCHLGLEPAAASRLWLVAAGAPYWRAFPTPTRYGLPLAYRFLPWLADRRGYLPGRHIGFGGSESRGVIRDWAGTALSGRYAGAGINADLETALAGPDVDIRCVVMRHDWLAPPSSVRFLVSKLTRARVRLETLDDTALGARTDHFAWMKCPGPVVDRLLA